MRLSIALLGALMLAVPLAATSTPAAAEKAKGWKYDGGGRWTYYYYDEDGERHVKHYYKRRSAAKKGQHLRAYSYRSPWGPFAGPPGLF